MLDFGDISLEWSEFTKSKKSGGVRHICAPNDELKAAQKQIKRFLEQQAKTVPVLRPTRFAHGFVPFRDTTTGVGMHNWDTDVFLCADIKDFFDNMPVDYVRTRLYQAGIPAGTVDTIIRLCSYKGRFPQGGPCSPLLMNIGMRECDLMLNAYAQANGFTYSRYADDLTLGHIDKAEKEPESSLIRKFYGMDKILSTHLGLKLKRSKNHIIHMNSRDKQQITGVVISQSGQGLNAPRRMRMKARAMCHNLYKQVCSQGITPELWKKWAAVKGYVCYLDHLRSKSRDAAAQTGDPKIKASEYEYLSRRFCK